tara:strand:- start:1186 stop:1374 length:189 start_codon:yes stop_codon:yes gene_type:complete
MFGVYKSKKILAIHSRLADAKLDAINKTKAYNGVIVVKDALGCLRFEVNPDAPEQHQVKEYK